MGQRSNGYTHAQRLGALCLYPDNTTKVANTYLNGTLVHSVTETDSRALVRASANPVFIGRNGSANVYHVRGLIDEVRIYNRALSAEEVRALAQ